MAGRPLKLTPTIQTRICKLIRDGNFRCVAARAAGVGVTTLTTWLARGKRRKTGPYRAFRAALLEAEQEAEIKMVARVVKASAKDAKHAEWWLERKRPDRWGRKDKSKVELTGADGKPFQIGLVNMPGVEPDDPPA